MYLIGTSGFIFGPDLDKLVYPDGINKLQYYASQFNSVEINSSYFNVPKKETVTTWYQTVPKKFKFIIKAHRTIINSQDQTKLKNNWQTFWSSIKLLKDKLAGILFEFNVNFKYSDRNLDKLHRLSKMLDPKVKNILELRDSSWYNESIIKQLQAMGYIVAIINIYNWINLSKAGFKNGFNVPPGLNKKNIFIRMHGFKGQYEGGYPLSILKSIVKSVSGHNAMIMFNNTGTKTGSSLDCIKNASSLAKLLSSI